MTTTAEAVRAIESSLDKGEVALPASELALTDLPQPQLKPNKIEKTPYTPQLDEAVAFFDEVKDSAVA